MAKKEATPPKTDAEAKAELTPAEQAKQDVVDAQARVDELEAALVEARADLRQANEAAHIALPQADLAACNKQGRQTITAGLPSLESRVALQQAIAGGVMPAPPAGRK